MDPLTILALSAALTAGGTAASAYGANQAQSARSAATRAEAERQRALREEAMRFSDQSRQRYENANDQRQERQEDLSRLYQQTSQDAMQQPDSGPIMPASASNITVQEQNTRQAADREFTSQQRDAQADLRSFGDILGSAGRGVRRDTGNSQMLAGFMRGSASVLPYELEAANQRGANARMLGDILSGLGRVGMMAGIGAGALGAGATAGAYGTTNAATGIYTPFEGYGAGLGMGGF